MHSRELELGVGRDVLRVDLAGVVELLQQVAVPYQLCVPRAFRVAFAAYASDRFGQQRGAHRLGRGCTTRGLAVVQLLATC